MVQGCDCARLHVETIDADDRVKIIDDAAPACACEQFPLDPSSPGPVKDEEIVTRFLFDPLHRSSRNGKLKPSVFSHVANKGCSIQREQFSNDADCANLVRNFLGGGNGRVWWGVVSAKVADIRAIRVPPPKGTISVCVYDSPDGDNDAHGELCRAGTYADESDANLLRAQMFEVFGAVTTEKSYRDGRVHSLLT